MKFWLDDVLVYFPFDFVYTEQREYMEGLKKILDAGGKGIIEMPTGTGKTVSLLSFIISYQLAHPLKYKKLLYCTRTFAELEKTIEELKLVVEYVQREYDEADNERIRKVYAERAAQDMNKEINDIQGEKVLKKGRFKDSAKTQAHTRPLTGNSILAIGMSARRALCIHPEVSKYTEREKVDAECYKKTARWNRVENEVSHDSPSSMILSFAITLRI